MVAKDAMYHQQCYRNMHNQYRSHKRKNESKSQNETSSYDKLVFEEIVAFIEEQKQDIGFIPIFYLKQLSNMYVVRLAELEKKNLLRYKKSTRRKIERKIT